MDDDRPTTSDRAPLDDAALALLIRDVTDSWGLPPQRLDVPTWRDRVARGRSAWRRPARYGPRRLLGMAAIAVVATVSLSPAVVSLITQRDPGTVGSSPSAGALSSPQASGTAAPVASLMPKLVRSGELPNPSRIIVATGQGYHIADLATGELSPVVIEVGRGPVGVLARPGGGWVCVCGDGQNVIRLSARTIDANGVVGDPTPIRDIVGTPDPRASDDTQPSRADVHVSASPDGRFGLIGWVRRDGEAGWRIGADVLDLATLTLVASTERLLAEPIDVEGRPHGRLAPWVRLSPEGDQILLASQRYDTVMGPAAPGVGTDHWLAPFDGRSIGELADGGATSSDVCMEFDAGLIDRRSVTDGAAYYAACWSTAGSLVVKRIAAEGRLVSATEFPGSLGGIETGTFAPPSGDAFFSWNPFESVLSRLDLATAELTVGEPQRPNRGGLTGRSGDLIVVSSDGSRVYALGIRSPDPASQASAGVYAFDSTTLAPLGHWAPLANLTSIAVTDDGRHVFAASDGGMSAAGDPGPEFGASVTAYNAADGSVALVAGRLGARDLTLGEAICR
jgi:hypothetical protein